MESLGCNYLKKLRENKMLTLREISESTGLSIPLISKIERGRISLSEKAAVALTKFYGIKIIPSKLIIKYENEIEPKTPEIKAINVKLRMENKKLTRENQMLKEKVNVISSIIEKLNIEIK